MKTTADIEAKIDNLFSAMESGDHKVFAEIISVNIDCLSKSFA